MSANAWKAPFARFAGVVFRLRFAQELGHHCDPGDPDEPLLCSFGVAMFKSNLRSGCYGNLCRAMKESRREHYDHGIHFQSVAGLRIFEAPEK